MQSPVAEFARIQMTISKTIVYRGNVLIGVKSIVGG